MNVQFKPDPQFEGMEEAAKSAPSTIVAAAQLTSVVQRIERLEEEKKEIAEQVKDVYAEAKANGFDVKTLRKVVALRKKDAKDRQEEKAMLDLYLHMLGM